MNISSHADQIAHCSIQTASITYQKTVKTRYNIATHHKMMIGALTQRKFPKIAQKLCRYRVKSAKRYKIGSKIEKASKISHRS